MSGKKLGNCNNIKFKNILISDDFHRENSNLYREIGRYVYSPESLRDIGRIGMYALLSIIIIIIITIIIIIITIIVIT